MSVNGLGPYPAYRDSGVEWLGKVPEHWEVRRVATVGDLRVSNVDKHVREGESPVRLCNYMDVYHNERIGSDLPFMAGTATEREIRRFRLAVGDVLVTKDSEDWSDIGVPALVEYAADDLVCGYHLAMLRPDGAFLDGGYLFQALRDSHVAWQFQVAAAGVTRYGLSQNAIRSMRVPLPPLPEQTAIARFLEAADRRIRRYIQAKERLIELLQERKRALIHEAVTGRTDVSTGQPYPAYKDSGVQWLGKVPEHWELRRNKSMLSRRKVLVGEDHPEFDLLSLTKGGVIIRDLSTGQGKFSADPGTCQEVRVGDLVFCLFDVPETPRTVGLSGHHGMITGAYTVLECPDRVLRRFLESFYIAMDDRKLLAPLYSGLRNTIPPSSLLRARSPVPPLPEQRAIVRFLDRADRRIRRHISATKRQIALLKEYRTRLIADVVTGKLDVREASGDPAVTSFSP